MELRRTREILERHGIRLQKSLGQNFLIDESVPRRTAESAIYGVAGTEDGSAIGTDAAAVGALEIGPGAGALTAELAARADKVVAIELDSRMVPVLGETLAEFPNVEIVEGDALKADIAALVDDRFAGMRAVAAANLPYYLTTPLIEKLLECRRFERVCVMVQKEVAQRIVAKPGSGEYGSFSVYCKYYAEPKILFGVSPGSFLPPPKVASAVVMFDCRRGRPEGVESEEDERRLFRLWRAAFSERRKKLAGLVAREFGVPRESVEEALAAMGLSVDVRGERLSLEEFVELSNAIAGLMK